MSFIKFSCMTCIIGGFIPDIGTLMSSLIFSSLTLIIQQKASHVTLLTQPTFYHPHCPGQDLQQSLNGFSLIHYCPFQFILCPAARVSDAEHNLNHFPPLPENLQWLPTAFGIMTRIFTKRHIRPEYSGIFYLSRHNGRTPLPATMTCSHSLSVPVSSYILPLQNAFAGA